MKTTDEIYSEMKSLCEERSGLTIAPGGDMALRLRAAAAQLESLWAQTDFVKRCLFPQTAAGVYLERHAAMRGITRGGAVKATGTIRFHIPAPLAAPLTIAAGTVCQTAAETAFATTADATIATGATYADAPARAESAGASGNVPPGSVTVMPLPPMGVSRCENLSAFTGGEAEEGDEALRERVLQSYKTLPNGANAAYYRQQALMVSGVAAAGVNARARGAGTVDVVVSAPGGMPEAALVSSVQARLDAAREICVDVEVSAPTAVTVNVAAAVRTRAGYVGSTVRAAVADAVSGCFTGARLGEDTLRAELGALIYAVPGVENYTLTAPAADVSGAWNELPVAGTVAITEMS